MSTFGKVATALRRRAAPPVAAVLLAACGATAQVEHAATEPAVTPSPTPPPAAEPGDAAAGLDAVRGFRSVRGHVETPAPARVRIPALAVDSTLLSLGREGDGSVEVPAEWQRAGWFTGSARPGQPGPAVILGHVDSRAGPAVFHRLHELRAGDEILVDRADGSLVRFTVDRVEHHDKDDFPTQAVYYPTLEATLRLVTCGGVFERAERSYRDNVIVFATQVP